MIIIRLIGGLGNQLFIYAFGRALQLNYNLDLYFDTYSGFINDPFKRKFELDNFTTAVNPVSIFNSLYFPLNKRSHFISKLLYPNSFYIHENSDLTIDFLREKSIEYNKIFLQGYFQKAEYFESIKEILKKEIVLKRPISNITRKFLEEINNSNAIAVHIRRKQIEHIPSVATYITAINDLEELIPNPIFYVFSDDINWCKDNLKIKNDLIFVEQENNHILDFWLLSKCKHFIIPESTFSWWVVWLGAQNDSVIKKVS